MATDAPSSPPPSLQSNVFPTRSKENRIPRLAVIDLSRKNVKSSSPPETENRMHQCWSTAWFHSAPRLHPSWPNLRHRITALVESRAHYILYTQLFQLLRGYWPAPSTRCEWCVFEIVKVNERKRNFSRSQKASFSNRFIFVKKVESWGWLFSDWIQMDYPRFVRSRSMAIFILYYISIRKILVLSWPTFNFDKSRTNKQVIFLPTITLFQVSIRFVSPSHEVTVDRVFLYGTPLDRSLFRISNLWIHFSLEKARRFVLNRTKE